MRSVSGSSVITASVFLMRQLQYSLLSGSDVLEKEGNGFE